jgi:hypothetical protein
MAAWPSAWISVAGTRQEACFGACIWRALECQGAPLKPDGLEVHIHYDPGPMELILAPEALDGHEAATKHKHSDTIGTSTFTSVLQV